MVKAELVEFSTGSHALCADVPALRKLQLPPPKLYDSGKLARLAELLPKLHAEGHRVLLFSQSTQTLDLLEEFVSAPRDAGGLGFAHLRLDGNTAVGERQALIDDFNREGSAVFCFLLSTRAGGQGLNLTGADTVILHDLDWNPQLDKQAVDRAHRIGQTRPVRVIRMVTRARSTRRSTRCSSARTSSTPSSWAPPTAPPTAPSRPASWASSSSRRSSSSAAAACGTMR